MTTALWANVPVKTVTIADLYATQPGVLLEALIGEPRIPFAGDPYPHVIQWRDGLYLEDGHHRAVRAWGNGARTIEARVLTVGPIPRDRPVT
jgi:hypothetical protein